MKKESFSFDFQTFFAVLYASIYPHSTEANDFKKGAAVKRVQEYAQEIGAMDPSEQEAFGIQLFHFLEGDLEYVDLNLFLINDFLKSYQLCGDLVRITDNNLELVEKLAS